MKRYFILGILVLTVALLSACSPRNSTSSSLLTTPAAGNTVVISDFSFSQSSLTVKVGSTVTWVNEDRVTHSITSDTGVFQSDNLPAGGSFSYTFNQMGTFPYHCSPHPFMKGSIIVQQ